MPPNSVLVTYTVHPTPQPTPRSALDPLHQALAGIRAQLPLRNLHWKSASRAALRTIQEVDVRLVELGEVGSLRPEPGGSVLDQPLVNLCLVTCDDGDTYKAQTRNFIRDWLSLLAARRNVHAPLIVLVNPASSAASKTGKNVFGRDTGIIAKIKADFNTPKRDRCVQLNLPPSTGPGPSGGGGMDPAAWVETINKLKESIVVAFDGAIAEREDEVKRGEAQRLMVGWNFCTWFLLKESLAFSFEGVNLHEDALVIFEELEATFFQVLKEQNLSWFGKLGATGPHDDSTPILDTGAKPYREMLQQSQISIFDFRIYVFARQCWLLGKLGRITEVAKRGQWFVASLARRLRESEGELAEHFIESWTYTACTDLVNKCDEWSRVDRPNGDYSGLIAYESARSELLDIARIQVERVGVACGHLPDSYPFKPASALVGQTDDVLFESYSAASESEHGGEGGHEVEVHAMPSARQHLSNRQFVDAMADQTKFRNLYLSLTKRNIQAYEACGKVHSIVRLKADMVALALDAKEWQAVFDLSRNLVADCQGLSTWDRVTDFALSSAIAAHRHLDLPMDEEWADLVLLFLTVCSTTERPPEASEDLDLAIDGLSTSKFSRIARSNAAFHITLKNHTSSLDAELFFSQVHVQVLNRLPTVVPIQSLRLEMENADGDRITFNAPGTSLKSGVNELVAVCSSSVQNIFKLTSSSLRVGAIDFLYSNEDESATVYVQRDPRGPTAVLRMPTSIALDKEQAVTLEVHAGLSNMNGIRATILSAQQDVRYLHSRAQSDSERVYGNDDTIDVGDIEAGSSKILTIPYQGTPQSEATQAKIFLSYRSSVSPDVARTYLDTQSLSMGLPLTVNVQDFFRPQCLLSSFTVASDQQKCLRIAQVNLRVSEGDAYEVQDCRGKRTESVVVTPQQPLTSLFKIRQTSNTAGQAVLRLVIQYCTIEDEIRTAVFAALSRVEDPSPGLRRTARAFVAAQASWAYTYIATSDLGLSLDTFIKTGSVEPPKDLSAFREQLVSVAGRGEEVWRWLEIPVDVPQHRLLTTARFDLDPLADESLQEGRPIPATVRFSTSYTWAGFNVQTYDRVVFDVQANSDDWLVLGRKKGYYTADPNIEATTDITLLPLRRGELFLPTVSIQLLRPPTTGRPEDDDLICETHVENAAQTVRVLPTSGSVTSLLQISSGGQWPTNDAQTIRA